VGFKKKYTEYTKRVLYQFWKLNLRNLLVEGKMSAGGLERSPSVHVDNGMSRV
jgi:hypothetical protein